MSPVNLLAVCAFLAASSALLLLYMLLSKRVARTPGKGKDSGGLGDDFLHGSATFKSPGYDPPFEDPPIKGIGGGALGLGLPIALIIMAFVSGCVLLAVRQSILMLLSTRPGERVMPPDYGCPIHRLVFSPNDATTAGLAIHYVRHSLLRCRES